MGSFAPGVRFSQEIYDALVEASASWADRIPTHSLWLLTDLFVPEWHDRAASPLQSFLSYLRNGLVSGIRPGPLFDAAIYRHRAAEAGLPLLGLDECALMHWLSYGSGAEIVPTDRFDEAFYRIANPDLAALPSWGFAHFIRHGVYEGRKPNGSPSFLHRTGTSRRDSSSMPSLSRYWVRPRLPQPSALTPRRDPHALRTASERVNELGSSGASYL